MSVIMRERTLLLGNYVVNWQPRHIQPGVQSPVCERSEQSKTTADIGYAPFRLEYALRQTEQGDAICYGSVLHYQLEGSGNGDSASLPTLFL